MMAARVARWADSSFLDERFGTDADTGVHGIVYEKELGPNTDATARRMTRFDPDESWRKASVP